jgi:hypothetical protein
MSLSRVLTNDPSAARLISLAKLAMAAEVDPRDTHGPYVIMQTGYVPGDLTMNAADYLLGRSGSWLAFHGFIRIPVQERRAEFVFGTVSEVMAVLEDLSGSVLVMTADGDVHDADPDEEWQQAMFGG